MNIFKMAYCRAYQTFFRLALPILPYRTPEIFESVSSVPEQLSEMGINSVLLVTDGGLRSLGVTYPLENALKEAGIKCGVYDKTNANPTVKNVEEAVVMYKKEKCGALIGFGGGSAMDCAKAVGARIAKPKQSLSQMEGILKIHRKLPPVFAVPTTAGTGSETTLAAVITDDETRHKFPINDFSLIPKYAVLDPQTTVGLPPFFTATTGMDALTHAVEAFIGGSTTKETRANSIKAVKLIMKYLEPAYNDGGDIEARSAMLRASFLAGAAFAKSYVGYCHSVAHSLGGKYNTPHGLANSVLLPYVLRAYGSSAYGKLKILAIEAGIAKADVPDSVGAEIFVRKIEEMNRNMNIPTKLEGIKPEDIETLAKYADKEGNPLYPVPRLMNAKELQRFYVAVSKEI